MFNHLKVSFIDTFVNNVRQGYATNSSSSHSMVFMKDAIPNHDDGDKSYLPNVEFGWEWFRLTTLREKLFYALVQIVQHRSDWMRQPDPKQVEEEFETYGHLFPEFSKEDFAHAMRGYVDHDSVTSGEGLLADARNPHIVFLGGNDNDDEGVLGHLPEGAAKFSSYMGSGDFTDVEEAKRIRRERGW